MKKVDVLSSPFLHLEKTASLQIETYKWVANTYRPVVDVFLCHNNEKLRLKMQAYEANLTIKEQADNGRIWCDSCLEFFVKPYAEDKRYINFEINPIGAMIMSIGEGLTERIPLVYAYKAQLNLKTEVFSDKWTVEFEIPFAMLACIYGNEKVIGAGDTINGNFYKCGDETPEPHFGMWNEIKGDIKSFHLPQYFGELHLF